MPSMRPSQYAMQQRIDDGPFLRFEHEDIGADAQGKTPSLPESESDFELELEPEVSGVTHVYYSDVALPDDSPGWHLILKVTSDDLTIYPIYPRSEHPKYSEPKYGTITSIMITRPVYQPYAHPTDKYEVDEVLSYLPEGFSKDWRYGLGFHYEYRFIAHAVAKIEGVETIMMHGEEGRHDTQIQDRFYLLGVAQFQHLRRQLDRLTKRHQRETADDKKLVCYAGLLHKASPVLYPSRARKLPPDILADLVALGKLRTGCPSAGNGRLGDAKKPDFQSLIIG